MPRSRITPCVLTCCGNRAVHTVTVANMRGETTHVLNLCGGCSSQPFRIIGNAIVEEREVAMAKRQNAIIDAEQAGRDFSTVNAIAAQACGIGAKR